MIITGARDVKTYLDNFECGPGINWSNPFDYHDTLIFQVIFSSKKTAEPSESLRSFLNL